MNQELQLFLQELKAEIHKAHSPWRNRVNAAAYANCSTSQIDKAANAGHFKRYKPEGTPMFKTTDLDRWIEGEGN